jgi:putative selenate reductase
MGYADIRVPETAFEQDTKWEQAQGIVERLGATAAARGLGLGVKFSNTLIVENHRDFFPAEEKEMYLSGAPLHVLAMNLVRQFRERFGDQYPITFSAGIDRGNFADAVAIGLTPITVCSDLLKPGGYGRASTYFKDLNRRMDKLGAENIGDYILRAYGNGAEALRNAGLDEGSVPYVEAMALLEDGGAIRGRLADETYARWVSEAKLLNTWTYVEAATEDPRYAIGKNSKAPRKIGSILELFDCISCDKCVPVCPNDANFTLPIPAQELPILKMSLAKGEWVVEEEGTLALEEKHQIANFADFCNECGNCDIFCPEDGGPYILKPRFFGDMDSFNEFKTLDGFCVQPLEGGRRIDARFDGVEFSAEIRGTSVTYDGPGFEVAFDRKDPKATIAGESTGTVDLTFFAIMECLAAGACDSGSVNYVSMLN